MQLFRIVSLLFPLLSASVKPVLAVSPVEIQTRASPDLISKLENTLQGLDELGKGIVQEVTLLVSALRDVQNGKIDPVVTLEEALGSLADVRNARDVGLIRVTIDLITNGLMPQNILDLVAGLTDQTLNSVNNYNPRDPQRPIFPAKSPSDAPYSLREEELRSAIHIPDGFKYGADGKRPVLLVPGTAVPAGSTYYFSYEKLLPDTDFADPVWINIPGNSLADVQLNAEYVAYAMNYISGITNTTIGMIAWSQGNINVQWALKYWPSTRDSVEDFMSINADFHGLLFEGLCLVRNPLCTPAWKQQVRDSSLIKTLRSEDGDSAYVPTTSVYTGLDQIVTPQTDPDASGHLNDVRGVGVTNTQIQLACPGLTAGGLYLHETLLVNPLAYALFVDALTHEGPGDLSRIDLDTVCNQYLPPGLGLTDLLGTEAVTGLVSLIDMLSFGYTGSDQEPPIKDYARI